MIQKIILGAEKMMSIRAFFFWGICVGIVGSVYLEAAFGNHNPQNQTNGGGVLIGSLSFQETLYMIGVGGQEGQAAASLSFRETGGIPDLANAESAIAAVQDWTLYE